MSYTSLARNIVVYATTTQSAYVGLFLLRELYLLGSWQEMEKDSETGWTSSSNILAEPTDLFVSSTSDFVIESATTPFTSGMVDQYISLYAANSANRGLYRIVSYLSSSKIAVYPMCRPESWTDESGISAKIHNAGKTDLLSIGSYFVMRAPSASGRPLEVKIRVTTASRCVMNAYPLGDYFDPPGTPSTPGLRTITGDTENIQFNQSTNENSYWNGYSTVPAGPGLLHHVLVGVTTERVVRMSSGELEQTVTGDDYPGFVTVSSPTSAAGEYPDRNTTSYIRMLDDTNVAIHGWPMFFGRSTNELNYDTQSPSSDPDNRFVKGRALLLKPPVIMNDQSSGGYIRGRLPFFCCNRHLPEKYPIDDDWMHWRYGNVLYRAGAKDKVLRGSI